MNVYKVRSQQGVRKIKKYLKNRALLCSYPKQPGNHFPFTHSKPLKTECILLALGFCIQLQLTDLNRKRFTGKANSVMKH